MIKQTIVALALALIIGLSLGFWLASIPPLLKPGSVSQPERKPLYYRHPMSPKVTSPTPAKDEMGMDYLPVYAEDLSTQTAPTERGRILYYRHPMGAADTSTMPKKDEMGMDYLPVYEGEVTSRQQVVISPEKIQKLGVKSETVRQRKLIRTIRALGSIQVDEQRVHAVTPKFEGWIHKLIVRTTGQPVQRGQALLEVYSPELVSAQQEYLIARQGFEALRQSSEQARGTAERLMHNALQRLRYWDIGPVQLQQLQVRGAPADYIPLLSPASGFVLDKPAVEGLRFLPGDLLFRIADLSRVWLLVDVFEQDLDWINLGQPVRVQIKAYPNREFTGRVGFMYPTLATETRTVKLRIELANAAGLLKPGLYGSVTLEAGGQGESLAVPDSAVLDSGTRQVVLIRSGDGVFQPRTVTLGRRADAYVEILSGVEAGEDVVTSANFLIDAESHLKSALEGLDAGTSKTQPALPESHRHEGQ